MWKRPFSRVLSPGPSPGSGRIRSSSLRVGGSASPPTTPAIPPAIAAALTGPSGNSPVSISSR